MFFPVDLFPWVSTDFLVVFVSSVFKAINYMFSLTEKHHFVTIIKQIYYEMRLLTSAPTRKTIDGQKMYKVKTV